MERLRALPEPQRAAIVMRELEGLSHEEIAAALGVSGGAARQAIYRARTALRDGLGLLVPLPLLRTAVRPRRRGGRGGAGGAVAAAGAASAAGGGGAALGGLGAAARSRSAWRPRCSPARSAPASRSQHDRGGRGPRTGRGRGDAAGAERRLPGAESQGRLGVGTAKRLRRGSRRRRTGSETTAGGMATTAAAADTAATVRRIPPGAAAAPAQTTPRTRRPRVRPRRALGR